MSFGPDLQLGCTVLQAHANVNALFLDDCCKCQSMSNQARSQNLPGRFCLGLSVMLVDLPSWLF